MIARFTYCNHRLLGVCEETLVVRHAPTIMTRYARHGRDGFPLKGGCDAQ